MSQRYIGGLIYNPPGGFSGYFDGSGDYLTVASNAALGMGTGNFTVELWFYYTGTPSNEFLFDFRYDGGSLLAAAAGTFGVDVYVGAGNRTGGTVVANTWYHLAVTRSGSTCYVFLNGAQVGATFSDSTNLATGGVSIASRFNAPTQVFPGYISNFRVVKGTALYTAAFTPPNGPLQAITNTSLLTCAYSTFRDGSTNNFTITVNGNTAVSTQNPFPLTTLPNPALGNQGNGVYSMSQYQSLLSQNLWPAVDPYWRYVTLMLHGNGTNGAQNNTFLDSSTNNFTITRNGNTTQGTFAPFGSNWSNFFDGSGDFLNAGNNSAFAFGTGDFTVECWIFATAASDSPIYEGRASVPSTDGFTLTAFSSSVIRVFSGSALISSSGTDYLNKWTHVAVCRLSGTTTLYINGVSVGTTTSLGNNATGSAVIGGGRYLSSGSTVDAFFTGYISNFRIVKGTAVYTSNFTPSTSPLTAITNTSLLTCQSNRFIDNSTNAFAITVNGNTSVQRFSPFNPTAPYAAGTDGGSGYFDGSGDYLSVAAQSALGMGSGDFTYEAWIYVNEVVPTNAVRGLFDSRVSSATGCGIYTSADSGTTSKLVYATNSAIAASSTNTITPYTWTHVAVTRSGTTVRGFLNGVLEFTYTDSRTFSSSAGTYIGADITPAYFNGYINDARILKGTAQYTSTFTPPSTPLTAITNTSLLLSMTNAGILDNAEMNNLETVGNAQISTAQSKFGGASMLFDGSGDYLFAASTPNLIFSGSFTIEFWVNFSATPSNFIALIGGTTANTQLFITTKSNGQGIRFGLTGVAEYAAGTQTWSTGTWYHVALVRNGTDVKFYVNGTNISDSTYTNSTTYSGTLIIGGVSGTADFNGYIDDLRITKGYARYTANFTPQRSQWQDQ